jgi:CYTH domain-containing protein/CHAD domain-containing protein
MRLSNGVNKRTWPPSRAVPRRPASLRAARVAGAVLVVAWAVVQYEGRRPRPPEAEPSAPEPPPGADAAGREIERKFLVRELPPSLDSYPREEIEQGYLAIDGEVELRVRRSGGKKVVLTLKAGKGESRLEEEFEIDTSRFGALWPLTKDRRLQKVRYRIPAGGDLMFELDVYGGFLIGLMTVEVEFPSAEASAAFEPPPWIGEEVTRDESYKNQALAQREARARGDRVFRLRIDEGVPAGIRRLAAGQIEGILERLEGRTEEEFGTAVHESRKSLKRLRAVVRLVRGDLGDDVYGRENKTFRDIGRELSGPRDAQVLIQALDALVERYPDELGAAGLAGFRGGLVSSYESLRAELGEGAGQLTELETELRAAEERLADWPLEHSGFAAVAPGLERAYGTGRRAYRQARREPSAENLHEWRKRVKDLWYSLQILEQAAPKRMKKLATSAHELSELLGDDHDLVVLEQRAVEDSADFPDSASPVLLRVISERRRGDLQAQAFRMGKRFYKQPPRRFVRDVERGWRKRGGQR